MNRIILFSLLFISPCSWGAITFDASATATTGVGGTTATATITVGSGANRIGIVAVNSNVNATLSTMTWGGSAMTQIGGYVGTAVHSSLWYFEAPASGSTSVTATALSAGIQIVAMSFAGVKQTSPVDTSGTSTANPPTVTLTTASANELLVDSVAWAGSEGTLTPASGQTSFTAPNVGATAGVTGSYRIVTTATSYTNTYTSSQTTTDQITGALFPAPIGNTSSFMLLLGSL